MDGKSHWEKIYTTKASDQVSWYQIKPRESLDLIHQTGVDKSAKIIDVGAGESVLVDFLLDEGFEQLTVLDISPTALEHAKARLGSRADSVTWIADDITRTSLPHHYYDVWHDRAVFHFLTNENDRAIYVELVKHAVKPGGHIIVASFGQDGPTQCSGLDVMRYSPQALHSQFGEDFEFAGSRKESHVTPFGTQQQFIYCYCRKRTLPDMPQ